MDDRPQPPSTPGAAPKPVRAASGELATPGARRALPSGHLAHGRGRLAWQFLREGVRRALEHGVGRMAAALAYFAMFSLPALLVFVLALAGLASSYESVRARFLAEVQLEVGTGGAEAIREMIRGAERLRTASPAMLWLGTGGLIFGALGFFVELQAALNVIFSARPRGRHGGVSRFTLKRLLAFGMILGIAVFLLLSLALSTLLAALGEHLAGWVPRVAPALLAALDLALNTSLIAVLFAAVYRVLPDTPPAWRDVRLGALAASASFSLGKLALGSYLARSDLATGHGAVGSFVVLLLWTYFSAAVLLAGAEIAGVRALARTGRPTGESEPLPDPPDRRDATRSNP